jgi:hypothetical protein
MRQQWQAFLELIWSSRYDPIASRERRIAVLQAVLAIAIALAAGPEVFVAMEMTAFMELLGAVLFLTAMSAGARLVALSIWSTMRSIAFPIPLPIAVRANTSILAKALASIYVAGHATWCVAMALNCRFVGAVGQSDGRTGG